MRVGDLSKAAQLVIRARILSGFESVLLIAAVCYFKSIPQPSSTSFFFSSSPFSLKETSLCPCLQVRKQAPKGKGDGGQIKTQKSIFQDLVMGLATQGNAGL